MRLRFVATCTLAGAMGACGGPGASPEVTAIQVPSALADAATPMIDAASDADDGRPAPAPVIADARLFESLLAKLGDHPLDGDRETLRLKELFAEIRALADPRAADGLARYMATTPSPAPRWRTQAALALAELGDARAVNALAWRLQKDPLTLYDEQLEPELRQDDNERVVAARLLADLVKIHPSKRDEIAKTAEDAVLRWAMSQPAPHANAMRFLGLVGSAKGVAKLRAWADPADPLPKMGAHEFRATFAAAQSALRHLGAAERNAAKRDEAAWALLTRQLGRRPAALDVSWDELQRGGKAVLGMTLRALAYGAADGFAEWGDAKAFAPLLAHASEPRNNEQSRLEACAALAWVATDADLASLVAKVKASSGSDAKKTFIRMCFLDALAQRPIPGKSAELADLANGSDEATRNAIALAIGRHGIDGNALATIAAMLGDPVQRVAAALALLLGGDERAAADAVAVFDGLPDADRESLQLAYVRAFGYVSDRAYDEGHVARWALNARACRADWPKRIVARALRDAEFDNGPRSLTRVVLRARLYADARGADAKKRDSALAVLEMIGEGAGAAGVRSAPATR